MQATATFDTQVVGALPGKSAGNPVTPEATCRRKSWYRHCRDSRVALIGLIDLRAQAEVPSARRADTPPSAVASGPIAAGPGSLLLAPCS